MRAISWNMGCSYGGTYKASNRRTWQQLLAWDPDFALVQETLRPGEWLDPQRYVFSPYWFSDDIGTLVYAKEASLERLTAQGRFLDELPGQVTLVEATRSQDSSPMMIASIHADTKAVDPTSLDDKDLSGVGGSHTTKVFPIDLILKDLTSLTYRRRFLIGGDLNASVRFDDLYTPGSDLYGNVEMFKKLREAGWWNCHRKFHAGDQRTLFRPGKPDEWFQIDHVFTDRQSWRDLTACDVLDVPFLAEFTDHAPLVMEFAGER